MIKNYHQTPEEIIKNSSPETRILWNHLFLLLGERISLSQYFYHGAIAASELVTFRAGRVFLALDLTAGNTAAASVGVDQLQVCDENNALVGYIAADTGLFDTVAAANEYCHVTLQMHNLFFGRIIATGLTYCKFIGYKITWN